MASTATARSTLKNASVRLFMAADKFGVHILPKHYYTSIPDYTWLRQNTDVWCRRVDLSGVDWNLERQLDWLREQCFGHIDEVRKLEVYSNAVDRGYGPGFGPIESQVLHCVCRKLRPGRIVEVGSGVSTACILHAIQKNASEGSPCAFSCVDPFPSSALSSLRGLKLIPSMVQRLPLTFFDELRPGDVLSIDSTHAVKTGSDVIYLYLEVLPRLKPGVLIHVHDIFLPYLFPPKLFKHFFDWQETSLLLALLKNNPKLSVLCCLSALHYDESISLTHILSDYRPRPHRMAGLWTDTSEGHYPASAWLTT